MMLHKQPVFVRWKHWSLFVIPSIPILLFASVLVLKNSCTGKQDGTNTTVGSNLNYCIR